MRWTPRLRASLPGQLTPGLVLLVFLGNLVLAALAALWLQIPDSHAWQFALSVGLGILLVGAALWLYATVLQHLRLGAAAGARLLTRMGLLAVWVAVWGYLAFGVGRLSLHVIERAGFWNSRLSASQRNIFTEPRLVEWQNDGISTLLWFVLPSLLLPLIMETVARGFRGVAGETSPLRAVARVYGRWQLWLTVGVSSVLATAVAEKLVEWRTYETVRGELMSLVLRLGFVYAVLVAIGLGMLTVIAWLLARASGVER